MRKKKEENKKNGYRKLDASRIVTRRSNACNESLPGGIRDAVSFCCAFDRGKSLLRHFLLKEKISRGEE